MKKVKVMVVLSVVLLAVPGLVLAQDYYGFRQGDWAVTLEGSGTSDEDVDNTTLSVEGAVGYFITDGLELGIRQGIGYADIEGDDDVLNASTRGFLDYNFNLGRFVPFLGVTLGYLYGDRVNDTFIAGPEGGLRYFMTTDAFLQALVAYDFTFDDADDADEAFDDGRFVYALGFGIRF